MTQTQDPGARSLDRFLIGRFEPKKLYAPYDYEEPSDLALSDSDEFDPSNYRKSKSAEHQGNHHGNKHKVQESKGSNERDDTITVDPPRQGNVEGEKNHTETADCIEVKEPCPRGKCAVRVKEEPESDNPEQEPRPRGKRAVRVKEEAESDNPEQDPDYLQGKSSTRSKQRKEAGVSTRQTRRSHFSHAETRYIIFMSVYKRMTIHEIAKAGTYEFNTAAWQDTAVRLRLHDATGIEPFRSYWRRVHEAYDARRVPAVRKDLKEEMKEWLRHLGKNWKPGREETLLSSVPLDDTARIDLA